MRSGIDFAVARESVRLDVVNVTGYPQLARAYAVTAVPKVVINDRASFAGALPPEQFAEAIAAAVGAPRPEGDDPGRA